MEREGGVRGKESYSKLHPGHAVMSSAFPEVEEPGGESCDHMVSE